MSSLAGPRTAALLLLLLPLSASTVRADPPSGTNPPPPTASPASAAIVDLARGLARSDRPIDAVRTLEERLRAAPLDATVLVALGEVERLRCRLDAAEAAYRRALETDLFDPGARAGLAEVLLLQARPLEALAQAEFAIEGAPSPAAIDGRPWRMKALALIELRRYDLAARAARQAAALSPTDAKCVECLAAAEFRAGHIEASRLAYEDAVKIEPRSEEANLRLGNGFAGETEGRPWIDGEDAETFAAAMSTWRAGDLAGAERGFYGLATSKPEIYKYRLGLGLLRLTIRRRNEVYLGGDPTALYFSLSAPEVDGLVKVVKGYDALPPLERLVVRVATAPAKRLWPALLEAGATHEVISLEADLTDDASRKDLAGHRTFDGRLYAHLRGVGGVQGATGVEKLREAAEFAFNTFAHELGHQIHRKGLTESQQHEIDGFYAAARDGGRFLDYYASSNPDEYFAQGYEAFVSPLKRGCLSETARHTRQELAAKDPRFFAFLSSVLDTSHENAAEFTALISAASKTASLRPSAEDAPPAQAEPASGR